MNDIKLSKFWNEFRREPYGYCALKNVFDRFYLSEVSLEIDKSIESIPREKDIYASFQKFKQSNIELMPRKTRKLIEFLNSRQFIQELEAMTGINGLFPDNELRGGGIHAIGNGGFLKLHTDFNWHPSLEMHRRLNLLIYLNEPWDDSWGGQIELWDEGAKRKIFSLSPTLGNALIFETTDFSYHGHPDPLRCPEGVYRKSIAMYYYSKTRPYEQIKFGKSNMTNYVERPNEVFRDDRLRRIRHLVQFKLKKNINGFLKVLRRIFNCF